MIEADRVHSTPQTDSSLRQPMFPLVAESAHAFPIQPATSGPKAKRSPASPASPLAA
jgi:hypothetical protein